MVGGEDFKLEVNILFHSIDIKLSVLLTASKRFTMPSKNKKHFVSKYLLRIYEEAGTVLGA